MRERLKAGTPHGGKIAFVFGALGAGGFGPPQAPATDEDRAVSKMAPGYRVNFARTGDSNGAGLPTWPHYDPSKNLIFEFHPDGTAGAIPDPGRPQLDVMHLATESGKRADV
jgi:para-nitrobenzyl esterase